MDKRLWIVIGVVGTLLVVLLIVTLRGGAEDEAGESSGDVVVGTEGEPPDDPELADILSATVRRNGDTLVFESRLGGEVPEEIPNGSLELQWDLSEGGSNTWIVSANVDVAPAAALASQRTDHASSTIDGSMPGGIEIDGDTVRVTVRSTEIEGFPTDFTWRLKTTLVADRTDPSSARAEDTAPDSGEGRLQD